MCRACVCSTCAWCVYVCECARARVDGWVWVGGWVGGCGAQREGDGTLGLQAIRKSSVHGLALLNQLLVPDLQGSLRVRERRASHAVRVHVPRGRVEICMAPAWPSMP